MIEELLREYVFFVLTLMEKAADHTCFFAYFIRIQSLKLYRPYVLIVFQCSKVNMTRIHFNNSNSSALHVRVESKNSVL